MLTLVPNDPESEPPIPAGIDTLGFSVPIEGFDPVGCEHRIMSEGTDREAHRWTRKLPGGGFIGTGVGERAWIEASLPKRVDGENWEAVSVAEAVDLVVDLFHEACAYIDVEERFDPCDAKIVRLDLVRDFHDVDDPTPVLDGLAGVDQPGRSKVRRFADPSAHRAETLRVGPRAWGCTLYDKHVETDGKAPAGQLRFEARLHADQLGSAFARNHGGKFGTIADLMRDAGTASTPEVYWLGGSDQIAAGGARRVERQGDGGSALARTQRDWFDRVGFGLACNGRNALAGRLRTSGLSNAKQGTLWAYLTMPGFAASLHRNTRRRYRNLAIDEGFAPDWIDEDTPNVATFATRSAVRLDYVLGELVAA